MCDCEWEIVQGIGALPADALGNGWVQRYLDLVTDELLSATHKHGPLKSAHEAYAVILEELDEMWDEVKRNDLLRARAEAVQVAAMAIRFLIDSDNWK